MPIGRENYTPRLHSHEVAYVQIIASPDPAVVGNIYALDHVRTSFGRTSCANVVLATKLHFPLGNIARNNTHITRTEDGVFSVTDFNGNEATALNGTIVRRGARSTLSVGDVIDIGGDPDPVTGKLHGIVRLVFRGTQLTPDDPRPLCIPTAAPSAPDDFGF